MSFNAAIEIPGTFGFTVTTDGFSSWCHVSMKPPGQGSYQIGSSRMEIKELEAFILTLQTCRKLMREGGS